jgi:large subunit ribosomal protein L25
MAAQARDRVGKGTARAARRNGMVPCVIYGNKKPAVSVLLERRIVERELHKGGFTNRLYDVDVEGKSEQVLPRDVQLHPITDLPMHVDFLRLSSATQIKIMVPVTFLDDEESPGLKRGGVLNVVRHEIEFSCRADAIPETIEISLDGLDIGDSIHISQVKLPDGVEPTITDRDFTIATIAAPTVATEEEEGEAAEGEAEGEAAEGEGEAAEGEASAEESGGEE